MRPCGRPYCDNVGVGQSAIMMNEATRRPRLHCHILKIFPLTADNQVIRINAASDIAFMHDDTVVIATFNKNLHSRSMCVLDFSI